MTAAGDNAAIWRAARVDLDGLPGGGLNIAHEAVCRHAAGSAAGRTAVRWVGPDGTSRTLSYAELERESARFAGALQGAGIRPGDVVVWLGGRRPELFAVLLGALRLRAVFCPLFADFGPEPLATRLRIAAPMVVVMPEALYRRRFAASSVAWPPAPVVLLLDTDDEKTDGVVRSYRAALALAPPAGVVGPTNPDDPALLHFTSGTTGRPKGVLHAHEAVVAHHHTARVALDLRAGDVFWCTADPGWVTGITYGVIAPLAVGATVVMDGGDFDAMRWLDILARERVAVWYTAPTALRLMRAAMGTARPDLPALRVAASVGEPLDAATTDWATAALGVPMRDTWWQTETGAIMIANLGDSPAGSMGRALPGIEAAVVERTGEDGLDVATEPVARGELALRADWPSLFRAYLGEPARYRACFRDGWYLTGDLVERDAEGRFRFIGRADDLIKCSGHLVGPTEVEAVLRAHPAVADAAVIGVPDPVTGERVHAFVVPAPGHVPGPELERALIAHARRGLGGPIAPRAVTFRDALPYTRSGKVVRRVLRADHLGQSCGDLSTIIGA